MEPRGCNRWQPVAGARAKLPMREVSLKVRVQVVCQRPPLVMPVLPIALLRSDRVGTTRGDGYEVVAPIELEPPMGDLVRAP